MKPQRMVATIVFDSFDPTGELTGMTMTARVQHALETHPTLSFRTVSVSVARADGEEGTNVSQKMNRDSYVKLIEEDITWLRRVISYLGADTCLEKQHAIEVLRASVDLLYPADAPRNRDARAVLAEVMRNRVRCFPPWRGGYEESTWSQRVAEWEETTIRCLLDALAPHLSAAREAREPRP